MNQIQRQAPPAPIMAPINGYDALQQQYGTRGKVVATMYAWNLDNYANPAEAANSRSSPCPTPRSWPS